MLREKVLSLMLTNLATMHLSCTWRRKQGVEEKQIKTKRGIRKEKRKKKKKKEKKSKEKNKKIVMKNNKKNKKEKS